MATTLQVFNRFASLIDNELMEGGSTQKPVSISVAGTVHQQVHSIANTANTAVYSDELGTFTFMSIKSDMNTRVVLTDTASNSFSIQLRGTGTSGEYGIPFQIGLDETVDASTTINSAVVHNSSGSTAKVSITVAL